MARLVVRRLLLAVPTLFVVATFSFLLMQLVPGDPALMILGQNATQSQIADLHTQLGLDQPPMEQYVSWLGSAITGDLGTSIITGRSVVSSLSLALPPTMSLAILATVVSLLLGVTFGMLGAVKGGWTDRAIQQVAGVGLAIPNFWVAYILILVFALTFQLFPATGYVPINQDPVGWLKSLVLPVASIAIANTCQILLQTRASVLDVQSRDFIRTLQATGIRRGAVLTKHVLRNAAIPVAVATGISFIGVFSGVVVIEAIFNTPGLGNLLLTGVQGADFPVVQGTIVVFAILVILTNLAVDLATGWLDPRVRLS
ncbi:ABC transporter permease [Actinotalea sp. M2MS4P-6]|uniref:ABC transporter permease n=1 Tax=Actinotalea sp. M2MS4P-6 TaxID=2983762 RepID=UPI0021E4B232|nr:ABC transporter permease [Actinotalea sp. M2MS4P-6]MCV2394389.1 ABC transporter permease [Actinotalea sp. M2MS4P-6]